MPTVARYTTAVSPCCTGTKRLPDTQGVEYREIPVERSRKHRRHVTKPSKRDTVPRIFLNDLHIGGYDDMAELNAFGKLDPLPGLESGSRG